MPPAQVDAEIEVESGNVVPARSLLGAIRVKRPTGWDVGAYALGLYCLGHEAGLLPAPGRGLAAIFAWLF